MLRSCSLLWFVFTLITLAALPASPARAEGYLGVQLGLGVPSGTGTNQSSGLAYGLSGGAKINDDFGLALTYQHDSLKFSLTDQSFSESQLFLELNSFSLFFLASGFHAGAVFTSVDQNSITDFGFGAHTFLDVKINEELSTGFALYWTYVTANNDKHSLFNFVVPLKYWF